MVIEARTIVGTAAAFAVLGAALWFSIAATTPAQSGTVQVQQLQERSWAVEVQDLGTANSSTEIVQTAAAR